MNEEKNTFKKAVIKLKKYRIERDNKDYEARAILSAAIGYADGLRDEIEDLIDPIQRVEQYEDCTHEQVSQVAYKVVSRQKTFLTLVNAVLNRLDEADKQLR